MQMVGGKVKKPGKRGRKPAKIDLKAKLERSRQSARECRARKKLRYQYLEELVSSKERAICALREELEMVIDCSFTATYDPHVFLCIVCICWSVMSIIAPTVQTVVLCHGSRKNPIWNQSPSHRGWSENAPEHEQQDEQEWKEQHLICWCDIRLLHQKERPPLWWRLRTLDWRMKEN